MQVRHRPLARSPIASWALRVGTAAALGIDATVHLQNAAAYDGVKATFALGAVLLYRYVDVGQLGPIPNMYENTWQVPGKLLSAYAEGAAVVLAGLGLLVHWPVSRDDRMSAFQRP